MTKIYTYKNGEKAYFENNEKYVISSEDYAALYCKDGFHCTQLHRALDKAVHGAKNISSYVVLPMSEILEALHQGVCTSKWITREYQSYNKNMERQEVKSADVELVYKGGELMSACVYGFYAGGESLELYSTDSEWNDFLKEWEIN